MNNFYRLSCLLCGALISFSLWAQRSQMPIPGLPRPAVMQKKQAKMERPAVKHAPMNVVKLGSQRLKVRLNAPENILSSWKETVDGQTTTGTVTYNANDLPVKIVYTNGDVSNFEYTMVDNRIWSRQVKTTITSDGRTFVSTDTRTFDDQNRMIHRELAGNDQKITGGEYNYLTLVYDISYEQDPEGKCVFYSKTSGYGYEQHIWFEPSQEYLTAEGDENERTRIEVAADGHSYAEYEEVKKDNVWVTTHVRYVSRGNESDYANIYYDENGNVDYGYGSKSEYQFDVPKTGWVTRTRYRFDDNVWKPDAKYEMTYNEYCYSSCVPANGDRAIVYYYWNSDEGVWAKGWGNLVEWMSDYVAKCTSDEYGEVWEEYIKYDSDGELLYHICYNADGSYTTYGRETTDRNYTLYKYYTSDSVLVKQLRAYNKTNSRWWDTETPYIEEYKNGLWVPASGVIDIDQGAGSSVHYTLDEQNRVTECIYWDRGRFNSKTLVTYNANGYVKELYYSRDGTDTNIYLIQKVTLSVSGTVESHEFVQVYDGGSMYRARSDYDTALQIETFYRWNEETQSYEVYNYEVDPIVTTAADGTEVQINREFVDGQIVNVSKWETLENDNHRLETNYVWDVANNCWIGSSKNELIIYSPKLYYDFVRSEWPLESLMCIPTDYFTFDSYSGTEKWNYQSFSYTRYDWDKSKNDWKIYSDDQISGVLEGDKLTIDESHSSRHALYGDPGVYKTIITRDDTHRLLSEKRTKDGEVIIDDVYSYNSDDLVATYVDQSEGKSYEFFYVKATGIEPVALRKSGLLVNGRSLVSEDGAVLTVSDLSGRTLAKGSSVTMNAAGVYLVTAGGKSYKVVVK